MSLPYETASSGDRALAEIQRTLAKFGCQSFGTMIDAERGCTVVQFKWRGQCVSLEANWKGYAGVWLKAHPYTSGRTRGGRAAYEERALAQAKVSVCSALRDFIKGQVTMVECGIAPFDAVFLPFFLLPSGERVIDRVRSEKMLPYMEEVTR
jgi:hypothetical protein